MRLRNSTCPAASAPCTWNTCFAMSKPIVVACSMDASFGGSLTPPPWHTDAVGGRPLHHPDPTSGAGTKRQISSPGTTADFRCFGPPSPLPINHLLCENCRTQDRMGEVGLAPADWLEGPGSAHPSRSCLHWRRPVGRTQSGRSGLAAGSGLHPL